MKRFVIILFIVQLFIIYGNLWAQETIIGAVYDSETKDPVTDANIYIDHFPIGTTTDDDGIFSLKLPKNFPLDSTLVIDHIAYKTFRISLKEALKTRDYSLQAREQSTEKILVEAESRSEISKELPVAYSVIKAEQIESKGYVDAGDLLRTEQSVQVDEKLSGQKTISLRAGNAENVLVLYNGIRMNNTYDNVFDLSLINVEDIKKIEIIKGSNTALYGSEGLSGVVNIVPKFYQPHTVRFVQKFGSYNSGDWSLQLNRSFFNRLHLQYNQHRSGSQRKYSENNDHLDNKQINHTANIIYNFSEDQDSSNNILNLMYIRGKNDYSNSHLLETVSELNQIVSMNYTGNIGPVKNLDITTAYTQLDNAENFIADTSLLKQDIKNKKYSFVLRKSISYKGIGLATSYQFDQIYLDYDNFLNFQVENNSRSLSFDRRQHGIVGLVSFESNKDEFTDKLRVAFSYRYDLIKDHQKNAILNGINVSNMTDINHQWDDGTFKASFLVEKVYKQINYNFSFSTGTNVKYPTLFNQISTPYIYDVELPGVTNRLAPEKNRSTETGISMYNDKIETEHIDRWEINCSYFKNLYENKFRNFYTSFSPIAFYDNIKDAELSGIEANTRVDMYHNALRIEGGVSSYDISDKAAFPLKSDLKYVMNLYFDKWNYNLQFSWFKASEQVGWTRDFSNELVQETLPAYSNFDIHLSKQWSVYKAKFKINLSGFNLISDNTKFNGLAIHDKRFYVGIEIKY